MSEAGIFYRTLYCGGRQDEFEGRTWPASTINNKLNKNTCFRHGSGSPIGCAQHAKTTATENTCKKSVTK